MSINLFSVLQACNVKGSRPRVRLHKVAENPLKYFSQINFTIFLSEIWKYKAQIVRVEWFSHIISRPLGLHFLSMTLVFKNILVCWCEICPFWNYITKSAYYVIVCFDKHCTDVSRQTVSYLYKCTYVDIYRAFFTQRFDLGPLCQTCQVMVLQPIFQTAQLWIFVL